MYKYIMQYSIQLRMSIILQGGGGDILCDHYDTQPSSHQGCRRGAQELTGAHTANPQAGTFVRLPSLWSSSCAASLPSRPCNGSGARNAKRRASALHSSTLAH